MTKNKIQASVNVDAKYSAKVLTIFSQYKYLDLCKAVFCINSWRYTRPHLRLYISLNYCLLCCEKKGEKSIETYSDFVEFCNVIFQGYDTVYDDAIIPDFGEIKVAYNNRFYSVLMGTGHDLVFPFIQSIELLALKSKEYNRFEEVLVYTQKIIDKLGTIEIYNEKQYAVRELSIPSDSYYMSLNSFYKEITLAENSILRELSSENTTHIDNTHFIKMNDNRFLPLFNPSIVIDYMNWIIQKDFSLLEKQYEMADILIYNSLLSNFDLSPESKFLLVNVGVVDDEKDHTILDKRALQFAICDDKSLLFFVNESSIGEWDIENYRQKVKRLAMDKKLKVVQSLRETRLYDFSSINNVEIIIYNSSIYLGANMGFAEYGKILRNNIYDLIAIFYLANRPSEIADFFSLQMLSNNLTFKHNWGGLSNAFDSWLKSNKEFSQGAVEYQSILFEVYSLDWNVFEKYISLGRWYPFENYQEMFNNPFVWIVDDSDNCSNYVKIANKAVLGFGGDFRKVNSSYVFFAFNAFFESLCEKRSKRIEVIKMIEELLQRNFLIFENELILSGFYEFSGIQLTYMPKDYAVTVDDNGFLNTNRKYVYSDLFFNGNKVLIRYTVNEETLLEDIADARDKSVECDFLKELLQCFEHTCLINYADLCVEIDKNRSNKKEIEVLSIKMDYYYSENNMGLTIDDQSYIKVRKNIAYDCKKLNIETGIYDTTQATRIIRDIQKITVDRFEKEIEKFDKLQLHKVLLSILAHHINEKEIDLKRLSLSNNQYVSDEAKNITTINTIKNREESKNSIRDISYLIDTNLAVSHGSNIIPTMDDAKYLIAFSHWLMVLQDCADEAHYGLFGAHVEISQDFLVSTVFDDKHEEIANERNKRIYGNVDYLPIIEDRNERLKRAVECFYEDTGIGFDAILDMCNYLSLEFTYTFKENEVMPDVFEIPKEKLVEDFKSMLIPEKKDKIQYFINALDYLTIDYSKIKTIAGKECELVPVWEREKRNCRFEVKPIVVQDNVVIFSPVVVHNLLSMWKNGTVEFYPPFEYGLDKYLKVLSSWKSKCEKTMEKDIEELFKVKCFLTFRNVQLHKRDKKFGHPSDLGDYDILAIDTKKKEIWNIESKFLGKVGSIREYYNHQYSFFYKDKKDEKFSRRISYLEKNISAILKALDIVDCESYSVKNYMVTNKVFVSDIKEIDFEIITFDELKKLLS